MIFEILRGLLNVPRLILKLSLGPSFLLDGFSAFDSLLRSTGSPGAVETLPTRSHCKVKLARTLTEATPLTENPTEKPNHDFGGDSVPYANYITLFDGNNIDIPQIDKTITRDICGKTSVRKVALRVRAIDKDRVNDDKIDNYKCFITGDQIPADNQQAAEWSAEIACPGEDRKNSKAYMKYRWYNIPESECRPSSNGRTFFSGMFS